MSLDEHEVFLFFLSVVAAVVVFIFGRWLASRARTGLRQALLKTTIAPSMTRLLLLLVYYGILLITLIIALALVGFPITALLTASLIVVVILGIALQQSIANLAATIVFMLFQPFKLGELIKANNVLGTVKEIQFFSTVLVIFVLAAGPGLKNGRSSAARICGRTEADALIDSATPRG